jgi:hypothetical protein
MQMWDDIENYVTGLIDAPFSMVSGAVDGGVSGTAAGAQAAMTDVGASLNQSQAAVVQDAGSILPSTGTLIGGSVIIIVILVLILLILGKFEGIGL